MPLESIQKEGPLVRNCSMFLTKICHWVNECEQEYIHGKFTIHGHRQLPQKGGSKYVLAFANSVDPGWSDQPAHSRSLIRVNIGRYIQ